MSRQNLLTKLGQTIMSLAKDIRHHVGAPICGSHALDKVMFLVGSEQEPINIKQLASLLRVTSGAIAQHITALEEHGFVRRAPNPDNRRETCIFFTDSGQQALAKIREQHRRLLEEMFRNLDEDDLNTLVTLFEKARGQVKTKEG